MARNRMSVFVFAMAAALPATVSGQTAGATISGTVTDAVNGQRVARAEVYVVRVAPTYMTYAPVTAAANGVFSVGPLPGGTYKVCVMERAPFANNCLLMDRTTEAAVVTQAQTYAVNVALRRGSRLRVRVVDPPGLARQRPGLVLLLSDAQGNVYPLSASGVDAVGQDFDVTIPTDVPLSLTARATGLVVRDEQNNLVGAGGTGYSLQHSSAEAAAGRAQKSFTFVVQGLQ